MAIRCPNCQHSIELAGAKAGHYRPSCPQCHAKFDLLISRDPNEAPRVAKLAPAKEATRVDVTAPPVSGVVSGQEAAPSVQRRSGESSRVDMTAPPVSAVGSQTSHASPAPSFPPVDRTQYVADAGLTYDDLHGKLGGYDILQKLGQGGMGSVYLARQLSLDRNVALKTLSPTLASDPQFVARFTREAYAAAQLNHHNVVQIHDIGQDRGTNFFSMELVEGSTLGGVVEKEGHLDPITAVNYTLQAARGLRFAHDHGLIHRDVKPENLLLNAEGVVKVADLGLVKRSTGAEPTLVAGTPRVAGPSSASATTTQLHTSMGTPAYMAPEQARDAAKVDQRADIYSLGCTLYDLVTGRPPFSGKTAIEVITKHQTEQLIPPEKLVANVPKRLSEIIRKMVAKQPEARYATMGEVVKELEDFLGVAHDGAGVRGSQDHVKRIEVAVAEFNAAPFDKIRRNGILAFYVASAIAFVIGLLTVTPWLAGGAVAFAVLATLSYQLVVGLKERTAVFVKVRQLVFGASIIDWLTWIVAGALAIALLYFFGQLWIWLGVAVLAAAAGAMFHFGVDSVVRVQREGPVKDIETLIKEMRIKGVDEDAIRGFVAKFSGARWEAFYETLFGYDEKIQARRLYGKGERGRDRKRHGVWRDWLIAWIDRKLEERKVDREERLIAKLEARALEAKGMQANEANRKARDTAARSVERAKTVRETSTQRRMAETLAPTTKLSNETLAGPLSTRVQRFDDDEEEAGESTDEYVKHGYLYRRFGTPLDVILGKRVRFLLAAVLLLGSGKWVQMNGAAAVLREVQTSVQGMQNLGGTMQRAADNVARGGAAPGAVSGTSAKNSAAPLQVERTTIPLRVRGVPDHICDAVGSWNGLVAGALLLLSVPLFGHVMTIVVLLGTAITLGGTRIDLPLIGATPWWLALGVGGAMSLLGMLFLRKTID